MISYDWPHNLFIGGIFVIETDALMKLLGDEEGLGVPALNVYLGQFQWPKGYASAKSIAETGRVNGQMSEYLSLVPVLREFLKMVPVGSAAQGACDSMRLLMDVVELLQRSAVPGQVTGDALLEAILAHARTQQRVYGNALWLPKSHFNLHLSDVLGKWGFLLNTMPLERKHKETKRCAKDRESKIAFEKGLMEEITAGHLGRLSAMGPSRLDTLRLVDPKPPRTKVLEILRGDFGRHLQPDNISVSRIAYIRSRAVHAGDACVYEHGEGASVGCVWLHVCIAGFFWSLVVPWAYESRDGACAKYIVHNTPEWRPASSIIESVIRSNAEDGQVSRVLIPPHMSLTLL